MATTNWNRQIFGIVIFSITTLCLGYKDGEQVFIHPLF